MTQTPAGWYPSEGGGERYWDGAAWTEQRREAQAPPSAPAPAAYAAPMQASKKSHTLRNVLLTLVALGILFIGGCAVLLAGLASGGSTSGGSTRSAVEEADASEKSSYTAPQNNAIRSAKGYLDTAAFSRAGLIRQLSSSAGDGYKRADAVFAVNHIKVDYDKQAVKAARGYLDMGGMSRAGLIQQLTSKAGNQYTQAQAEYAADKVGL